MHHAWNQNNSRVKTRIVDSLLPWWQRDHLSVDAINLSCCLTEWFLWDEVTGIQFILTCKRRWLECYHLSMPYPPAACVGPTCVQHALYIVARPDSVCVHVCTLLWYSVTWDSVTFWWQSYAFNYSNFCTCTRLSSPLNVVHSSSIKCCDILAVVTRLF